MAKLLDQTVAGDRVEKTWLHTGDDGRNKLTVEHVEDVEPVFKQVKQIAQTQTSKGLLHHKASIPATVIDETCKINASLWGVSVREAFAELIQQKTKRSKSTLKMLTEGRDYRKFQSQYY